MRYAARLAIVAALCTTAPAFAQSAPPATPSSVPTATPAASPSAQPAATTNGESAAIRDRVKAEFAAWQSGKIDRTGYSAEALAAFTDATVANVSTQLKTLGAPAQFKFQNATTDRGDTIVVYRVECAKGDLRMVLVLNTENKIDGIAFRPAT